MPVPEDISPPALIMVSVQTGEKALRRHAYLWCTKTWAVLPDGVVFNARLQTHHTGSSLMIKSFFNQTYQVIIPPRKWDPSISTNRLRSKIAIQRWEAILKRTNWLKWRLYIYICFLLIVEKILMLTYPSQCLFYLYFLQFDINYPDWKIILNH